MGALQGVCGKLCTSGSMFADLFFTQEKIFINFVYILVNRLISN